MDKNQIFLPRPYQNASKWYTEEISALYSDFLVTYNTSNLSFRVRSTEHKMWTFNKKGGVVIKYPSLPVVIKGVSTLYGEVATEAPLSYVTSLPKFSWIYGIVGVNKYIYLFFYIISYFGHTVTQAMIT